MDIQSLTTPSLFSSLNRHENRTLSSDLPLSQDRVSLSRRASTLNQISQTYFSGSISSSNIPALSQALYEGGFLTDEEFMALGGNLDEQGISSTSQANRFINRFLSSDAPLSDEDRTQFENVIGVISNMDQSPDAQQRINEQNALNFIEAYRSRETFEDEDILAGLSLVNDVLSSLEHIRTQNA